MSLPWLGESYMSPTGCGEHSPSVLAHLAKVLAMQDITENEVLKAADSGCANYSKRMLDTH